MKNPKIIIVMLGLLAVVSCGRSPAGPESGLRVVVSTNILGDVVNEIGGDLIDLNILIPAGTDPHSYEPNAQDIARVADADLIFVNGLGLEEFLARIVQSAGLALNVVVASDGVDTIEFGGDHDGKESEGQPQIVDPHVWMDPNNVMVWADNIAAALSEADPANRQMYTDNAAAYKQALAEFDAWALQKISELNLAERVLVTDHDALGYFALHYQFEVVGTVIPGLSTLSEPSAAERANLEALIAERGVGAIFVGSEVNPDLAEQIAADSAVQVVPLYSGSLSGADGPSPTYLTMMRYNVETIVAALQ
ncbi:MAG: zinc ABC transporter substrate-binding protein [Chloroflexi bacterium]|nr:zinc ABC transporter substrate-binding protein [Chloroflexota bacterium]